MRTKLLTAAAAILAAGALSSMAQSNVYSVNVVGYVNVTLTNGFQIVANQLDLDGTGANNTIYTAVGTNVPNLTKVFWYNVGTGLYGSSTFVSSTGTWSSPAGVNPGMQPGQAFWIQIPASASYPQTVTFVGNVMQGVLNVPVNTSGFGMNASIVPQSGGVTTALGFTPANLDKIYQYVPATGLYASHTYVSSSTSWSGGEPTPAVGEGLWIQGHAGSAWSRNFTVQ